ncbi:intraflagellar transport protein 74 homolog [Stegodyphus dumicola]|uniref:intraflagellar transport protein 74 homolog n=1 Tax=Stegodyphus dumicola TaxID=202533 RepID=UPI0015AA299F|nr:intraflagellar transport protein 74 homolog [Stegodyphus dumicola]
MLNSHISPSAVACCRSTSESECHLETRSSVLHLPLFKRNVTDRLISDQGLVIPKKSPKYLNRHVKDKSYYIGLLLRKGYEISSEMKNLMKEIEKIRKEQSTYHAYRKKAEAQVLELQHYQMILSDYNTLEDLLQNDMDVRDVNYEYCKLKSLNERKATMLENLFQARKKKENLVSELETDINQENYISDILDSTVNPQITEQYKKLKKENDRLQNTLKEQEEELQQLNIQRKDLDDQYKSLVSSEVRNLFNELRIAENERDALLATRNNKDTPEEKLNLQRQHVENKIMMNCIVKQLRDVKKHISQVKKQLSKAKELRNNFENKRKNKYSKLQSHEEIMDHFLSCSNEMRSDLLREKTHLEITIESLLKEISRKLWLDEENPLNQPATIKTCNSEKNVLDISSTSNRTLRQKQLKLALELEETEELEAQIQEELSNVRREIAEKEKDIAKFHDFQIQKTVAEKKQKQLQQELEVLKSQQNAFKYICENCNRYYDTLRKRLNNNPTFEELSRLENRWHTLEQENFVIKESIDLVKSKIDYFSLKNKVLETSRELNKML